MLWLLRGCHNLTIRRLSPLPNISKLAIPSCSTPSLLPQIPLFPNLPYGKLKYCPNRPYCPNRLYCPNLPQAIVPTFISDSTFPTAPTFPIVPTLLTAPTFLIAPTFQTYCRPFRQVRRSISRLQTSLLSISKSWKAAVSQLVWYLFERLAVHVSQLKDIL